MIKKSCNNKRRVAVGAARSCVWPAYAITVEFVHGLSSQAGAIARTIAVATISDSPVASISGSGVWCCSSFDNGQIQSTSLTIDKTKPVHERVHIGGEIMMVGLTQEGISLQTLKRFDDYEVTFNQAAKNL